MGPKPQLSVNDRKMKVSKGAVNVQGTQGFISFSEVVADATPKSNTSPLYMGTDPELSTVSKKLTKKNEVTILKAFADLEGIFQVILNNFGVYFCNFSSLGSRSISNSRFCSFLCFCLSSSYI
jgi:hypothetical protein